MLNFATGTEFGGEIISMWGMVKMAGCICFIKIPILSP